MNFDNLMHYDLMAGMYMLLFLLVFLILIIRLSSYSLHSVIQFLKEFTMHSVQTVSEVSQKSGCQNRDLCKTKIVNKRKNKIKNTA